LLTGLQQPLAQVMLVSWGFLAVNTFGVRSLNPPRLIQPPNVRYLIPIAPMLALIVFGVSAPLLRAGWVRLRPRLRVAAVAVACSIALFASSALGNLKVWGPKLMLEYEASIRQAFDDGVPIYVSSRNDRGMFNVRGYLRPEQVMAGAMTTIQIGANRGKVLVDKRREPWRHAERTKTGYSTRATRVLVGKTVLEARGGKLLKFSERKLRGHARASLAKARLAKSKATKSRFAKAKPSKRSKRAIRKRRLPNPNPETK
jgi:hypothetical protein